MGGMEIIPTLFQDIGWGSLLIVNEFFFPMMLYEFYANLQRGRIQTGGNVVTSRLNGKNIVFDDRLLNSILETPEDGMLFYTKNKKFFDPNLYSEKRCSNILRSLSLDQITTLIGNGKIYNQNTFKTMGFSRNEDGKLIRGVQEEDSENSEKEEEKEEEEGNEPEDMDEESGSETEEERFRRETRKKKRQERTEEGSSSCSMTQLMETIASLQT
ncbi:hypothetical protein M9H77_17858 [Catharanthus roseus]|uniref:Uncharacterized protein n=1 Tax=Catharanthus roseus TaxID=4058 RepID=A0ACC0B5S8_CATRO|nr:hypothetical protein M9H77_17858 [Catharanthus roseus]